MSELRGQRVATTGRSGETATSARRLPQHTVTDLLVPISTALDLAEGRSPGHAHRVAFIAVSLAETMGLDAETRLACCHAALVHDIGVVATGAEVAAVARGDERLIFASLPILTPEEAALGTSDLPELVVERLVDHAIHGARAAQELMLAPEAVRGVASHHENWDGSGYPHGLRGQDIPVIGRILAIADQLESLIDQSTPLAARRNMPFWLSGIAGREADPELLSGMRALTAGDTFWLGLFGASLANELSAHSSRLREPKSNRLLPFVETFSQIVDFRFSFTVGVSARVAKLAESLGKSLGISDLGLKKLRLAALLHDVGQLAVSERIMAKPGILSVEELDLLRMHPVYSRDVIAGIAGLEDVAEWVVSHHERLDGRGYPDAKHDAEVPLEAQILAICDSYVAITSDRPHRPLTSGQDAAQRLRAAAGAQLNPDLVELFLSRVVS